MAADDGRGSQRGERQSASRSRESSSDGRGSQRGERQSAGTPSRGASQGGNADGRGSQREARSSAGSASSDGRGSQRDARSSAASSAASSDGRGSQREARASIGNGLGSMAGVGRPTGPVGSMPAQRSSLPPVGSSLPPIGWGFREWQAGVDLPPSTGTTFRDRLMKQGRVSKNVEVQTAEERAELAAEMAATGIDVRTGRPASKLTGSPAAPSSYTGRPASVARSVASAPAPLSRESFDDRFGAAAPSAYAGRPASVARDVARPTGLAGMAGVSRPDGPISSNVARSKTGYGPVGDVAASAYGAVKDAVAPTFNSAMTQNAAIDGFVDKMIGVESGYNPKAKNPLSSATGLGQFISSTWTKTVDKYRPDLAGVPRAEKLAMRTDPTLSRQMTKAYAIDNAKELQKRGIAITKESVYAAHFLGPVGAVKAYSADPSTSAVSVLGSKVVNANPSIMRGKTIGQVLGYVDKVMNRPDRRSKQSAVERMATTYMGRPASVASSVASNNMATTQPSPASSFPARPAGPISQNPNAGYTPRAADPSLMSVGEQAATFGELPGGAPNLPAPRSTQPTSPAPTPVSPSDTASPVAPNPNDAQPVSPAPSTPVSPVAPTPVSPTDETTVKAPLSTAQKVAAAAIDTTISVVAGPVAGPAYAILSGLGSLVGIPTVGGMAVDLLGDGSKLGQQGRLIGSGEGNDRSRYTSPETEDGDPEEPPPTIRNPEPFVRRYLRPTLTPMERWGRDSPVA